LNFVQLVMEPTGRLKYQVEAEFSKVYGKIIHTTSLCCTFINLISSMNFLMWSSGNPKVSGSNLGRSFSGCLGKLCNHPGIAKASLANHGWLFSGWSFTLWMFSLLSPMSSDLSSEASELDPTSSDSELSGSEWVLVGGVTTKCFRN
jgi:hypothetical protein